MSERGEIEVLLPVARKPTRAEHDDLVREGFAAARRLLNENGGGDVLGLVSMARAETPEGAMALRMRIAVRAPERNFTRRLQVFGGL